jgi:SH3 domain-containing YSC84-like protein 1
MKTSKYLLTLSTMALICASLTWAGDDKNLSDIDKRIDKSATVLTEIMATPDHAVPDAIINHATCIAVIPSVIKLAIGFGGEHGRGVASCRTADGAWSAPAPITLTGGSWGLQLGGQATDFVLVFMGDHGMEDLLHDHFKLGGDASAAAGPVGRDTAADTDIGMQDKILTYSRARGLFAGIDLSGAVVSQDKDETRILFGNMVPFDAILRGKVPPPSSSEPLLSELRKVSAPARDRQAANANPR